VIKESSSWPTPNMLALLMGKDPNLWMSYDFLLFDIYKFDLNYMSGLKSEEKPLQCVNTLSPIPFVDDINFSPSSAQRCTIADGILLLFVHNKNLYSCTIVVSLYLLMMASAPVTCSK